MSSNGHRTDLQSLQTASIDRPRAGQERRQEALGTGAAGLVRRNDQRSDIGMKKRSALLAIVAGAAGFVGAAGFAGDIDVPPHAASAIK